MAPSVLLMERKGGGMLDLNDLYYFVNVVDHKGFSAAGRALSLPKSRLSRRIAMLEAALEARLLHRSPRQLALTDAGQDLYRHASAMLLEAEAAEAAVRHRVGEPLGMVRLACSVAMAQFVTAELLPRFMHSYPRVEVVQHASNRYVDPVGESFDLVLRAHNGPLPDSSLVQRRVATIRWYLVAAPTYLDHRGTPLAPTDLDGHDGLMLGTGGGGGCWRLRPIDGGDAVEIAFRPRYCSNDMTGLRSAAVGGLGILALPGYICRGEIDDGRLVRVLPHWHAGDPQVSLLMPSRRGQLPAVKALADFLLAEFAPRVQ